jgi:hypothetical protein
MIHLIVVIMGIALMSYMLLSGISYTNPETYDAREKVVQWSTQNLALSSAWTKYRVLYGRNPGAIGELTSELSLPLALPDDLQLSQMTTTFHGWCFTGSVTGSGLIAIQALTNRFPTQYGLSDQCGSENGVSPSWSSALESSAAVPVVLTFKFSN